MARGVGRLWAGLALDFSGPWPHLPCLSLLSFYFRCVSLLGITFEAWKGVRRPRGRALGELPGHQLSHSWGSAEGVPRARAGRRGVPAHLLRDVHVHTQAAARCARTRVSVPGAPPVHTRPLSPRSGPTASI